MSISHYHNFYSDNAFMFRHITDENPDNSAFSMHIHDQCEIFYFIKGAAIFMVETTTYKLMPDQLILMRPMESHRIAILDNCDYERYTINFKPDIFDTIDPDHFLLSPFYERALGENNLYDASEFDISPRKLMEMMSPDHSTADRVRVISYLPALLGQINVAFKRKSKQTPGKKILATQVADYINEHLFEELDVPMLARMFYVSVSQLNRHFRKATGSSIWEYISGKRLIAARNLIQRGVPPTHAYEQCGFYDYSSFYRLYLKRFGTTPKADSLKK